jgi:hypothetical protein
LLDAGRGEVYAGLYSPGADPEPLRDDAVMHPERVAEFLGDVPALVFGPGADRYATLLDAPGAGVRRLVPAPDAVSLAVAAGRYAARRIEAGGGFAGGGAAALPLTVHYVRRSDARLPGAPGSGLP